MICAGEWQGSGRLREQFREDVPYQTLWRMALVLAGLGHTGWGYAPGLQCPVQGEELGGISEILQCM